jgi:hypothetical protein
MVDVLKTSLPFFPGPANRVRCLAHVVNLVAKVILRPFDTPKGQGKHDQGAETEDDVDDADLEVIDLAIDSDNEENEMDAGEDMIDNEVEGVIREDVPEIAKLARPFRHVLQKVSAHDTSDKSQLTHS